MPSYRLVPLAAALLLAACSPSSPSAADAPTPAPADPVATTPSPGADPVDTTTPQPTAPTPAPGELSAVHNDPAVINFEGFGPAKFGADEEAVRQAWGRPLQAGTPMEGATCYQLWPDPKPQNGSGIRFMLEEGGFVRYDVDVPEHVAPGDLTTGMTAADVKAKFPDAEEQPGKYDPAAKVLIVAPADGGAARLVFVTDASGTIVSWHIGVPPQVHYVEGCG